MHINLSSLSRLFSPGSGDKKEAKLTPEELDSISSSFDESLLIHLRGLSPASVSLAWLSSAVGVLNFAHSAVKSLLPNLELDKADSLLSWYFVESMKVLDLCNCISSEIARLHRCHVKLRITIEHLHSDPNPSEEEIRRAINLLVDLEGEGGDGVVKSTGNIKELIRDPAASVGTSAPQGKVSPVERATRHMIHAAVFVTVFVAGVISTAFHASPGALGHIHVPEEFPWRDSFHTIEMAVIAELGRVQEKERKTSVLKEIEDVEARVRHLIEPMDEVTASGGSGDMAERIREMAAALEKATGVLLERADRLTEAVDGLFETVMEIRTKMTDGLRERLSPERPFEGVLCDGEKQSESDFGD
ncbi:hypothetical protein ACJRO7_004717 [Eucalyptus globulus]|uniref:Uncharacterized protein n=1 Tax=Eucalyptus globulus TaxID=34317 RepID=A0ABD3J0Z8_EUCGL